MNLLQRMLDAVWAGSIRKRLVVSIALTQAVLLGVFVTDLVARQRAALRETSAQEALALAEALAASSTSWVLANDTEGLAETISSATRYPVANAVMVLSPELKVLAHGDPTRVGTWLTDPASRTLTTTRAPHLIDARALDAAAPIITGTGRTIGWVRVQFSLAMVDKAVAEVGRAGAMYVALAVLAGVLLALLIAGQLTKEVEALASVADRVRQGEVVRHVVHRHDELGRLGLGFNAMLDRLLEQQRAGDALRAELERSEAHLERAIASASEFLWSYDPQGREVTLWVRGNGGLGWEGERTRRGATRGEKELQALIYPGDLPLALAWAQAMREGKGHPLKGDLRVRHADGRWLTVQVRGSGRSDQPDGPIDGTIVDVTDLRRHEDEAAALHRRLLEAQKMEALGRLAGGVAHDFNNMLAAIQAHATLARQEATNPQQQQDLDTITQAAQRAAGIAAQVLAFGRGNGVEPGAVDVVAAVKEVRALLEPTLQGITVELRAPDAAWARAERSGLVQVLLNLCVNARDVLAGRGHIVVEVASHDGQGLCASCHQPLLGPGVRISVIDDGPGITPELQSRVFEPFFTTRSERGGSGLGLSVAHGLVHGWQGHLQLESQPGRTAFHAWLPATVAPAQVKTTAVAAPKVAAPSAGKVLVVDDEPLVGKSLARVLRRSGFEVQVAEGVEEAVATFGAPWHAVVTDYSMRDGTGLDLARQLRERGFNGPIVLMTGNPGVVPASDAVNVVLGKPLDVDQLLGWLNG